MNPENFPPLRSSPAFIPKRSLDAAAAKVSKNDIVTVFEEMMKNGKMLMNENLKEINEVEVPVICKDGHLRLEIKDPLKVPNSTTSTPQSMRPIK